MNKKESQSRSRILTTEEQKYPVTLELQDIVLIYSLIQSSAEKNLFSPREYSNIGNLFQKCEKIIKKLLK